MPIPLRALIVEDSESDAFLVLRELERAGYEVTHQRVYTAKAMRAAVEGPAWDIVISDHNMPGFDALAALELRRQYAPDLPFIIVSGMIGEEAAVVAMRSGAADYVMKGSLARLVPAVQRVLGDAKVRVERRQALDALRESEERFRQTFEVAASGMAHVGLDGRFLRVNRKLCEILGYPEGELIGHQIVDYSHPDDRDLTSAQRARLHSKEIASASFEKRYLHKDGSVIWASISVALACDAAGNPEYDILVLEDITERKRTEQELQRFRLAMDMSLDSIYLTDPATMRFVYVNNTACRKLGYARAQLLGMGPMDVLKTSVEEIRREYDQVIEAGERGTTTESRFARSDHSEGWTELTRCSLATDTGWLIVTIGRDITERKVAEKRIARLNRVYAVLSGINSAIVRVRDRNELFGEACRIAVSEGGFLVASVIELDGEGKARIAVTTEGDPPTFNGELEAFNRDPETAGSLLGQALRSGDPVFSNDVASDPRVGDRAALALTADGSYPLALLPLTVGKRTAGLLVLRARETGTFDAEEMKLLTELAGDIGFSLEHIEKSEKLEYLAYYDGLTGLANRTLFQQRLDQHMAEARGTRGQVALLLMNIERFKMINDTLGRQAGDELLRQVAGRLSDATKEPARLARIGGDVFAAMAHNPGSTEEMTLRIVQWIEQIFGVPFLIGGSELRVSARFGIAMFPGDGGDAEALFKNAEAALKKAKVRGERYLFYTQKMTGKVAERLSLENKLRQGLERDEFVLHYQPKVDLETRSLSGVEALIRWQSPELGLVPPLQFIPLMEVTGLILDVGAWALRQAVRDHRYWVEQGLSAPRIAVNVSPVQLRRPDFVAGLEEAIREGASPHGLDLEITESLIMQDIDGSVGKLAAARDLAIGIAIDDFGTGYSSLAYLARLPVQTLKIDRSFIITMLKDPNVMMLVQTMISLAHSLRLKVVAEGVDEEEQAKMLRLLRCDEMQGYLFSKPLPFDAITALLKK